MIYGGSLLNLTNLKVKQLLRIIKVKRKQLVVLITKLLNAKTGNC